MTEPTDKGSSFGGDGHFKVQEKVAIYDYKNNFEKSLRDSQTKIIMELGSYYPNSTSGSVITSSNFPGVQGTNDFLIPMEGSTDYYNSHLGTFCPRETSHQIIQCSDSSREVKCIQVQGGVYSDGSGNHSLLSPSVSDHGEIGPQDSSLTTVKTDACITKLCGSLFHNCQSNSSSTVQQFLSQNMQPAQHQMRKCPSMKSLYSKLDFNLNIHPNLDEEDKTAGHSTNFFVEEADITKHHLDTENGIQLGNLDENAQLNEKENSSSMLNTLSLKWQGPTGDMPSSSTGLYIPDTDSSKQDSCDTQNTTKGVGSRSYSKSTKTNLNFSVCQDNTEFIFKNCEGLIGATGGCDPPFDEKENEMINLNHQTKQKRVPPVRLGLLGGGESSLNNSTSTWGPGSSGNPGASNWSVTNSVNSGTQWNSNGRQGEPSTSTESNGNDQNVSVQKQSNTWAQAAGKGLCSKSQSNGDHSDGNSGITPPYDQNEHSENGVSVKPHVEDHLSELQLAAVLSDGWGKTTVNQDTSWDVPSSPHLSPKETNSSVWRAPVNNGTEVWENNIRHRNKGSNLSSAPGRNNIQPWGHTPSTNIGGTWGEEEDNTNMWTGVPPSETNNWGNVEHGTNMWGNSPNSGRQGQWNGPGHGSSWDGSGGPRNGQDNSGSTWNHSSKASNIDTWAPIATAKKDFQSSGWEDLSSSTARHPSSSFDDGTSLWGNPHRQAKVCNWKDGPPTKTPNGITGNNMPSGGSGMFQTGPGMIRLPSSMNPANKSELASVWGKIPPINHGQNWSDIPRRDSPGPGVWDESHMPLNLKMQIQGAPGWSESNSPMGPPYWGAKPRNSSMPNWIDGQVDTSNWTPMKGGKPLTKDLICASKQFRILTEMGFKREDAENALRNNLMNLEEAVGELQAVATRNNAMDMFMGHQKLRHGVVDDINLTDYSHQDPSFGPGGGLQGPGGFQGPQVFSGGPSFKHQIKTNVPHNSHGGQAGRINQQSQPSATQLKLLVQQIQMAVQAGHLNPQILNQPLAPQTLQLLYQLLQQIKVLHQIQQQQLHMPQQFCKGGPSPQQLNVHITQTKQRIHNLRNQIAAQQAHFIKQQQINQQPSQAANIPSPQSSNELFKPSLDSITSLSSDLHDLSIQEPTTPHTQSRLSQWKLPSVDKGERCSPVRNVGNNYNGSGEFSRAPGTMSKPIFSNSSHSTSNIHSVVGQGNSTWSSLPRAHKSTGTWPEPSSAVDTPSDKRITSPSSSMGTNNLTISSSTTLTEPPGNNSSEVDKKELVTSVSSNSTSTNSVLQPSYNLADLVAEFEPGKPWKGNSHIKNIEDDPHITPGSVARSPLSLHNIKEPDFLGWSSKSRPPATTGGDSLAASLASLTWAINPALSNGSGSNKYGVSKSSWNHFGPENLLPSGCVGSFRFKDH
ncbi:protein Gawky-like isoform X2 [Tachypleus tridentatus]|uniref:protein Gawky-like isoform X2 n=1 Tax=Tachypleus tridentatus TaxID=6853 RepID=UPI003FD3B641